MYAPCKNCKDRHPACHDSCPKYKEFKKRIAEQKKKERYLKATSWDYKYY